ncbi:MAG: hypothetical protein ABI840_08255 [bacterium]
MNKIKSLPVMLVVFLLTAFGTMNFANAQSAPGVSASPNKKSYSPGESGFLTINFKTGSKVKIPKEPEVVINLTSGDVEAGGLQDYTGGDGDYINNSKVKYNFTVPAGAASGSALTISGSVKFGYCSTTDGVCKIGTKNFTAKVKVK